MHFSTLRRAAFAALLALAPSLAGAQEVVGTIEATFQGEDKTWYITFKDAVSESSWTDIAGTHVLALSGQPAPDALATLEGSLFLSVVVMDVGGTVHTVQPTLQYLSGGYTSAWLAQEEGDVTMTAAKMVRSGDVLEFEADFVANVAYSEQVPQGIVDETTRQVMTGHIAVKIPAKQ